MLTTTAVRAAKPGPKSYKLADEKGLFVLVHPNGGRYFQQKYRFEGKEKLLSFGVFPDVSLAQARARRDAARLLLADGIDPGVMKRQSKQAATDSFEAVAREWHAGRAPGWAPKHAETILRRLMLDVFPHIGSRPIADVTAPELLAVMRRIEGRGAVESSHRNLQVCSQIFRFAISAGRAERNPAADLKGALRPTVERHFSSITEPVKVGELLRALQDYDGYFATKTALRLAPLVFVRPGELRHAEWAEVNLDAAEWRIPAHKMKAKRPHVIPLATQAVAILRALHHVTGSGKYLFPSVRTAARPMSNNTINAALRRMGYDKNSMTGHGFRSLASTILNEQGWDRDVIERQLAHAEGNAVRAAYNFAEHLPERRRMMQAWADYLDGLAAGAAVIPFRRASSGGV